MKVKIKIIGFRALQNLEEASVDFSGESVKDLLDQFLSSLSTEKREVFLSAQGDLSPDLAVFVNGSGIPYSQRSDFRLKENDVIELVSAGA
jgi:sulfur carrier protein ThiS